MIGEIKTIEDVHIFFEQLLAEGLNFHPDTDFTEYINSYTRLASYSSVEAGQRNNLLDQAFEMCAKYQVDIYETCINVFA